MVLLEPSNQDVGDLLVHRTVHGGGQHILGFGVARIVEEGHGFSPLSKLSRGKYGDLKHLPSTQTFATHPAPWIYSYIRPVPQDYPLASILVSQSLRLVPQFVPAINMCPSRVIRMIFWYKNIVLIKHIVAQLAHLNSPFGQILICPRTVGKTIV